MELAYGKTQLQLEVPPERLLGVLFPNKVDVELTGRQEVERALSQPIGAPLLGELVKSGMRVAIIASDITRPMPSRIALPPLVDRLNAAGIPDKDIFIVFALGSHRSHTEEEKRYLAGELYGRITLMDSDERNCTHLGCTSKGTSVDVFTPVAEADFVICTGNIEYHYFAGYSGGMKAIMPGVCTSEAIRQNHSMMVDREAKAGNLNSPVRQDIDEVYKLIRADYILNAVLDEHKNIIKAVAGHYIEAHRAGCAFLDSLYKIRIKEKADIVVVSAGGYPKDQNMYQAQKALDNAKHAVKDGGVIIWLADCGEGLGSATFEKWMRTMTPSERVVNIQRNFVLGGHKAAAVSIVLENARIFLVSSLESDFVKSLYLEPYPSLEKAFAEATEYKGKDSTVIVMPYGGSTLPVIE